MARESSPEYTVGDEVFVNKSGQVEICGVGTVELKIMPDCYGIKFREPVVLSALLRHDGGSLIVLERTIAFASELYSFGDSDKSEGQY